MGRNKNNTALATAAAGRSAKERHQRVARETITVPHNLVIIPEKNIKSKHQSYFQFFENKDRKEKRLEFEVTTDTNPPPGFEFVPIGNPALTKACKELSREQEAMIFIVSAPNDAYTQHDENVKKLALQVHRMGHHVRRTIVEQARKQIGQEDNGAATDSWQLPETQEEINAQAEAAIRDLFPRIPNFDRQMIIEHSFRKGQGYGKPKVGTSDLPLHRRVQLAVLAHIRHTHTRYDHLLKEADWHIARKAVEKTCLDILVKWRGDEETGRDQLDDILREVVVISDDSEDSEDSEDSDSESDQDEEDYSDSSIPDNAIDPVNQAAKPRDALSVQKSQPKRRRRKTRKGPRSKLPRTNSAHPKSDSVSKKNKRGFKRYEAAQATMTRRWEEAISRHRHALDANSPAQAAHNRVPSQTIQRQPSIEIIPPPVHRVENRQNTHVAAVPQQPYRTGENQDQYVRSGDVYRANTHRGDPQMRAMGPTPSDLDSPQGIVIGRRVSHLPMDTRSPALAERHYHGELRDFLVPSIEPVSPQSGPGRPHFVRPIIREQMHPEQVPTRGTTRIYDTNSPLENQPRAVEYHQRAPVEHHVGRSMQERHGDSVAHQNRYHYGPEVRPLVNNEPPREVTRVYRVREPIEEVHRPAENSLGSATRIIRVHRETRPTELWAAEPGRLRELSPHRVDGRYNRPLVSPVHENVERRHVVYREASVSRFNEPFQSSGPRMAHPLSYEVWPVTQPGPWQGGSTFVEPISQPPPSSGAPPGGSLRRPTFEPVPEHFSPAEYNPRGYPRHEEIYSSRPIQASPAGGPGYYYEQQPPPPPPPPPRDPSVIIIR